MTRIPETRNASHNEANTENPGLLTQWCPGLPGTGEAGGAGTCVLYFALGS